MPIFKYKAKTPLNVSVAGEVEGVSKAYAASLLVKKGYSIISLEEASPPNALSGLTAIFNKVSLNDQVNFTSQLSVMLSSGLALTQSLEILSSQAQNKTFKTILETILRDVQGGSSLTNAMSRHPKAFGRTYVALLRAGEASGSLDRIMLRLGANLEKEREVKGRIKGAMVYPAIISLAMVLVFTIIIVFVIPKLTQMYASLNVELPLPTKIMIWMSDFAIKRWWAVLLIVGAVTFGIKQFKKTTRGEYLFAKLALRAPIFGNLTKQSEMADFSRTLSLLISSGVPIVEGLDIVGMSLNNLIYRNSMKRVSILVEKGLPLSQALSRDPIFPPLIFQMVSVGEETGKMDEVLGKVSSFYEMEVDRVIKNLSTALEPIIMIALGGMVGLLIISIITPIYKLTSSF